MTDTQRQYRVPRMIPPVPHGFGHTEDHELAHKEARRFLGTIAHENTFASSSRAETRRWATTRSSTAKFSSSGGSA